VHPACASRAVLQATAAGKVGEVIRLGRRARGLSQRQLGAATDPTISRPRRVPIGRIADDPPVPNGINS